ncbi:C4-dicarboxylate ABC transporter permease, partial [Bacillus sp. AFS075960]
MTRHTSLDGAAAGAPASAAAERAAAA